MEIVIGYGDKELLAIQNGSRFGLLIRKTAETHVIGEYSKDNDFHMTDNDVIIWIDKLESGRVLQDTLAETLIAMQKYKASKIEN